MTSKSRFYLQIYCLLAVSFLVQCSSSESPIFYVATLHSPGGDITLPMHVDVSNDQSPGFVLNQADTSRFTSIQSIGDSLKLSFDHYDSHIMVATDESGNLRGRWWKTASGASKQQLPFSARRGYLDAPFGTSSAFNGEWNVIFRDSDGEFKARGVFSNASGFFDGTFLTETGDYRFLRGTANDSTFELSTFDAAHAYYFKASLKNDILEGEFWSSDNYYATFSGTKGDSNFLADPSQVTKINANDPYIRFSFPDEDGNIVSNTDQKFQQKALLFYVFGTWCPNCGDEARLIRTLYEEYKDKDIEIIGVAHEYTDDFERDSEMVKRYRKRFNIPWTLLIAGNNDKSAAAQRLTFVEEIVSFPTSFFADSSHKVLYTHTGFNGPGTGTYYQLEIERFKHHIHAIIPRH